MNTPIAPSPIDSTLVETSPHRRISTSHLEAVVNGAPVPQSSAPEGQRVVPVIPNAAADAPSNRKWTRRVSVVFFAAVVVGLFLNRGLATDVWGELHHLSVASMLVLGGLVLLHKCAHATFHRASLRGLRLRHAVVAAEAYTGASNAVIGGSGIGTGLRVAMFRSWGAKGSDIAVSIWLTALVPSFAMWTVAGLHAIPRTVLGQADRPTEIAAAASVCFLSVPGVFWWLMLRRQEITRAIAIRLASVRTVLFASLPKRVSERVHRAPLFHANLEERLEDLRARAHALGLRRGLTMFAMAVSGQLLLATILVASVRSLGPSGASIDVLAVFRAFALLRVLSSFVPVPGGIGVIDVGLLGVLTSGGVEKQTAIAAIALYRGLTFVLPMLTGPICAAAWRVSTRRRKARETRAMPQAAPSATPPRELDVSEWIGALSGAAAS